MSAFIAFLIVFWCSAWATHHGKPWNTEAYWVLIGPVLILLSVFKQTLVTQ